MARIKDRGDYKLDSFHMMATAVDRDLMEKECKH